VHVELFKLLAAKRPSLGLGPMAETGIWALLFGPMATEDIDAAIAAVELMRPDPVVRLARLLWPLRGDRRRIEAIVDKIKPSRDERVRIRALTDPAIAPLARLREPEAIRRLAAALGRRHLADATDLLAREWAQAVTIEEACRGAALSVGELALGGQALVDAGIAGPGPGLGRLLGPGCSTGVLDGAGHATRPRRCWHARARSQATSVSRCGMIDRRGGDHRLVGFEWLSRSKRNASRRCWRSSSARCTATTTVRVPLAEHDDAFLEVETGVNFLLDELIERRAQNQRQQAALAEKADLLAAQQDALVEALSTPIIEVWPGCWRCRSSAASTRPAPR
jgi:hypothetical protein